MNSVELRKVWDKFWVSKDHMLTKPASLIVNNTDDPTTMFNTAGMQPLVPYLMGKEHPTGSKRVYNIQWCVRTVDIDEVGDLSHLTYFEMMGNRSLGDYFKKEAIDRSWEFLTSILWLNPEMLCATIFEWDDDAPLDTEARDIWSHHLPEYRITPLDKNENRRWPAGATGPCGPDSEIFYWVGEWTPPQESNPGTDDENRLEIWNNVFMGYYKDDAWVITEMEKKNVDTGMWFERILMVIKWQKLKSEWKIDSISSLSVYDIDIFQTLFDKLSIYSFQTYAETIATSNDLNDKVLPSFRIVADHLKTSLMLVNEWLAPSNEGRGYVLRRIIRRAYYHLKKISLEDIDWSDQQLLKTKIVDTLSWLQWYYSSLSKTFDQDIKVIIDEMSQFESALQRWGNKIEEILTEHTWSIFSWDDAFLLYDTFWVPVELTQEIVSAQWLEVDMVWYQAALETAKATSRAGAGDKFAKGVNRADHIEWLPETKFVWYDQLEYTQSKILKDFDVWWSRYLIFDCTPFYAESWWQKGDSGVVELDGWEVVEIVDVLKYGWVFLHKVR